MFGGFQQLDSNTLSDTTVPSDSVVYSAIGTKLVLNKLPLKVFGVSQLGLLTSQGGCAPRSA